MKVYKISIIGDAYVGKSSIVERYIYGSHTPDNYSCTIGVEFHNKDVQINNKDCRLQLWDTAGQERFRALASTYYRNSNAAIIVFDLSNMESYNNVITWYTTIRKYSNCPLYLVGNKSDSKSRCVTPDMIKHLLELFIEYHETSSVRGTGIDHLMNSIASNLINNEIIVEGNTISQNNKKNKYLCQPNCCIN